MDILNVDDVATYFRSLGISRDEGVERSGASKRRDPSRGGSRGYDEYYRRRILDMKKDGVPIPKAFDVSRSSKYRWKKNGIPRKKMTGNKRRQGMPGHHRLLLACFKKVFPHASAAQCAVYIAIHSDDNQVFTDQQISKALKDMKLTRKVASTTAYQAFTDRNLRLHHAFWNNPYPSGICDTQRKDLIDIDECGFELKDAGLSFGHAVRGMRVRKVGNYGRGTCKITLILAIEPGDPNKPADVEGSIEKPRLWYRLSTDKGTSTETYTDFLIDYLMDKFDDNENQRTLMHDNLSSHKSDVVVYSVYKRHHRVICRPPYRPHEAPIEYVFDQLACEIRKRWARINTFPKLVKQIHNILASRDGLGGWDKLFKVCGYLNDDERSRSRGGRRK